MEVLFATTNPAKVKKIKPELQKNGINLRTLSEIDTKFEINENGKNAVENAYIKAKTCYDATKITSIGMDNNLFIEGITEEEQPGVFVRRVNGKDELNDDEMIEYYTGLVKKYGGKLKAKWVFGIVVYNGKEAKDYSWEMNEIYFVDKPSEIRNPGYPLNSITIIPKYNKYYVELTSEEKQEYKKETDNDKLINFLLETLK